MIVKRIVIPIMSVIILASQLSGCAALSSQEFLETVNEVDEVVIEYNDINKSGSSQTTIEAGGRQYEIDNLASTSTEGLNATLLADQGPAGEDASVGVIDQKNEVTVTDLSQSQLQVYFTKAYEMGKVLECSIQDRITSELSMVEDLVARDNQGNLPTTYKEDYNSWRLQQLFSPILSDNTPEATTEAKPIEQTVYVTGTVNIRSTWSTEGEKLGAFNKGQAIVRVGVGIEGTEAEGWSQIKVSDGQADGGTEQFKLVYVSNKYISTTKPSSGQSGNSSGSKQGSGSQSQTQATASKPSGSQQQQDPSIDMPSGTPITGNSSTGTTTPSQPSGYIPPEQRGNTKDKEFIENAEKGLSGDLSGGQLVPWD